MTELLKTTQEITPAHLTLKAKRSTLLVRFLSTFEIRFLQLVFISATVIVKVPDNVYVVEEEKLEITCIVKGTDPVISWEYSESSSIFT